MLYQPSFAMLNYYTVTDTALVFTQGVSISLNSQNAPLNGLHILNDSLFFALNGTGGSTDQEFIAFTPNDREPLFRFSTFPTAQKNMNIAERLGEYSKLTAPKPDGSKFAAFYRHYNRLKIFDNKGSKLSEIEINDPSLTINSDYKFIYRFAISASENYIYLLAANTLEEELSKLNVETFRPSLEVWDWNGHQIFRSVLDKPVQRFVVSEKYGKLYGFSVFNKDIAFIYSLTSIMDQ